VPPVPVVGAGAAGAGARVLRRGHRQGAAGAGALRRRLRARPVAITAGGTRRSSTSASPRRCGGRRDAVPRQRQLHRAEVGRGASAITERRRAVGRSGAAPRWS
jgi:hypothetical protein